MKPANHTESGRYSLPEAIRATIAEHLYEAFSHSDSLIGNLNFKSSGEIVLRYLFLRCEMAGSSFQF